MRQTMELAEEHRVKESLQRAVLPARLPSVGGVELAARYLPADMPSLVGGDWYDAFCLPDGSLAVAVGGRRRSRPGRRRHDGPDAQRPARLRVQRRPPGRGPRGGSTG